MGLGDMFKADENERLRTQIKELENSKSQLQARVAELEAFLTPEHRDLVRLREEAKLLKEIEEERKRLEKEQTHYLNALAKINAQLAQNPNSPELNEKRIELEQHVADAEKAIKDVDYREANKRAGYVYVISNVGAFGENVYKIRYDAPSRPAGAR